MSSDDDDDGFIDSGSGDPLEDAFVPAPPPVAHEKIMHETDSTAARPPTLPVQTPERKIARSTSQPPSGSKDSAARASSRNSSFAENGEINAKNIVIATLQKKVQDCTCQKMAGVTQDDIDSRAVSQTNISGESPSRYSSAVALPTSVSSSRNISADMETSNSTDAEKLATYSDPSVLQLVIERDKLQEKLNTAYEEKLTLRQQLDWQEKDHQLTLNLKEDAEKLHNELQVKYTQCLQEKEDMLTDCNQLRHQLESEHERLMKAETELTEYRKIELELKEKIRSLERQLEFANVAVEPTSVDMKAVEAFSSSDSEQHSSQISNLQDTVDLLVKELKENIATVKRQNETIRRLKRREEAGRVPHKEIGAQEQQSSSNFRSRGYSPPMASSLHLLDYPPTASTSSQMVPTSTKSQRQAFYATSNPSEEDLYGASSPVVHPPLRNTGPFDLDSYESELNRVPRRQATGAMSQSQGPAAMPAHFPQQVSTRSIPSHSHSQPLNQSSYSRPPPPPASHTSPMRAASSSSGVPVYPPSSRPVEQSDADSSDKMCPICNERQPHGTTMDDFQTHVMMCLAKEDESTGNAGPRVDSAETMCPVCSFLFPPGVPNQEVQAHVNAHFDEDYSVVERESDPFATPRNA